LCRKFTARIYIRGSSNFLHLASHRSFLEEVSVPPVQGHSVSLSKKCSFTVVHILVFTDSSTDGKLTSKHLVNVRSKYEKTSDVIFKDLAAVLKFDIRSVVMSCRLVNSHRRVESSSIEIKNEWCCASTSPYAVMACTGQFYQR
jgi:hypothetical protein